VNVKRIGTALAAATAVVCLAAPAASAVEGPQLGPGEWDYLGSSALQVTGTYNYFTTNHVKSGGGDFAICLEDATSAGIFTVMEYDPDNADDKVREVYLSEGACSILRDIGGYVDGDNNRAEFYVATAGILGTIGFWD
jgi:hypothetical protein